MHKDPSTQLHINFPSKSSYYFQRLCPSSSRFSISNNHTQNPSHINFQHSIPILQKLQQQQTFEDALLTKIAQMESFVTGLKKNIEKKQISMLELKRQRIASSTLNCTPKELNNVYRTQKSSSISHNAYYKVNTESNFSSIIRQNSIESFDQDNEKLKIQKLVQLVKNRAPSKQYIMKNSLYVSSLSQAEKKQQNQTTSTYGEGPKKKIQRSKNKKVTIKLNNNNNYTKAGYLDTVIQNENQNTINISPKSKQKKFSQPKPLKLKN